MGITKLTTGLTSRAILRIPFEHLWFVCDIRDFLQEHTVLN